MATPGPSAAEVAGRSARSEHRRGLVRCGGNPRTVPTDVAAIAAGVTPATIRKWASRGKITRYGRPGRAEYDIEELLRILASAGRIRRNQHG